MNSKKKPSIAYIITKLELGGAQKVCLSLFTDLQKNDHITWLISGTQGPLTEKVKKKSNVILLPSLQRECSWKTIGNECKTFFSLIKILKKLSSDHPDLIVHTHSTKAGYLGRWAGFFARIKKRVHTIHGFGFHEHQSRIGYGITYLLELITSLITTHYICVSTNDQNIGTRLLPWFSSKNSLIRAAVEDKKFVSATVSVNYNDKVFVFGTVSCFKEQKNLFDLLTAFEKVYTQHNYARLEIIGDGYLRSDIELWIKEKKLTNVITLHGWQEDVAHYMKQWHVFVMSSLWEGLPCAAVEARFLKLPVICYQVGGIQDLIISGKNGFLYEQKNIHGLVQGMSSLITDPILYKKLRLHPDDLSTFTCAHMIKRHSILYQSIAINK